MSAEVSFLKERCMSFSHCISFFFCLFFCGGNLIIIQQLPCIFGTVTIPMIKSEQVQLTIKCCFHKCLLGECETRVDLRNGLIWVYTFQSYV